MANTTASLTNINLLSKTQYDAISSPATDELWAVDIDSDTTLKEMVVGWGAPDLNNVVKIGLTNNNDTYTAPMDGYVFLTAASNNYATYTFDGQLIQIASYYYNSRHLYRVGKGTVIKKIDGTTLNSTNTYNAFVPCKGVNQ